MKHERARDVLDREMAGLTLSREVKDAMLEAARQGSGARGAGLRPVLAAVVLCVLLAASALALSPDLRATLISLLGGFAPYSQTVEGVSAEDQGIELRLLSTVADDWAARVYLEVIDHRGDRLGGTLRLEGQGLGVSGGRGRAYDPAVRTALAEIQLGYGIHVLGGDPTLDDRITLQVNTIRTGEESFAGVELPRSLLTDRALDSHFTDERLGYSVLEPGQTPAELGTELFTLSSMGFDKRGALHIQVELADGVTGGLFPLRPAVPPMGGWQDGNVHLGSFHTEAFGDGRYLDMCFEDIKPGDLDRLILEPLEGSLWTQPPIEGSWTLTFPLTKLPGREIALEERFIPGLTLERLTITTLQLRDYGATEGGDGCLAQLNPVVHMADGTLVRPRGDGGSWYPTGEGTGAFDDVWYFEEPIEVEEVTGISYGYWMIPIQGSSGGPGFWLDGLPGGT